MLILLIAIFICLILYTRRKDATPQKNNTPIRVYDPEVEPVRRLAIDLIKDANRINALYREAKRRTPDASERQIWLAMVNLDETYVEPARDEHPIISRIVGE